MNHFANGCKPAVNQLRPAKMLSGSELICDTFAWHFLRVKLLQHKLKIRKAEGYCTDAFRLMIIWSGTTLRRFTNKQSPSEESAPETFIGMKDDKRDHQDSKFWACVSEFEWASPIHYRCKSLSMENLAKLHNVCSSFQYKVNSSMLLNKKGLKKFQACTGFEP